MSKIHVRRERLGLAKFRAACSCVVTAPYSRPQGDAAVTCPRCLRAMQRRKQRVEKESY
jgi:hypothetical protein